MKALAARFVSVLCTATAGATIVRAEWGWAALMIALATICLCAAIEEDK